MLVYLRRAMAGQQCILVKIQYNIQLVSVFNCTLSWLYGLTAYYCWQLSWQSIHINFLLSFDMVSHQNVSVSMCRKSRPCPMDTQYLNPSLVHNIYNNHISYMHEGSELLLNELNIRLACVWMASNAPIALHPSHCTYTLVYSYGSTYIH